jgi:RNA polymerase sigma-70 factor (ECF subfamily)
MANNAGTEREAGFLRLLDTYGGALRRLSAAYLQSVGDQQDLFQEIAAAIWSALPGFRGDASERTWVYRIAHNVAYSYAKKRRRQCQSELQMDALPDHNLAPEDPRRPVLLEAVQQLDSLDRQVVLLYLEGLSAREIEQVTGMSANSIGVRLSRLRRRLASMVMSKEVRE